MLKEALRFGDPDAKDILIQITGEQETDFLQKEFDQICALSGREDILLIAIPVSDWNMDQSPWEAPAVFGNEGFGGGAQKTLEELSGRIRTIRSEAAADAKLYLGGYSLAGLFALWAGTRMDAFEGIAAASPSVWFPGFTDYLKTHPVRAKYVYLSLGDREERTRHPVMRTVGDAIRETEEILKQQGIITELEWNPGNHFKEPDLRMAKGFARLPDGSQKRSE